MSKPANRHTPETETATQGLTRRRALQAGAVAGTGIALAALGGSPAMAGTGRQSSTAPGSSPDWTAQWIGRNDPATRPALGQQAPPAGLDYAAASVETVRGLVASSWRRTGNELELTVEIPGNTTAQVDVPVSDGGRVQVSDSDGVRHLRTDGGYASYTAGSGQHRFVSVP